MDAIASITTLDAKTASVRPVAESQPEKTASAEAQAAPDRAPTQNGVGPLPAPRELLVEVDEASGRFVHTFRDPDTEQVELKYPSDTQLAFSRAVTAYL